ncbi:MAG: DUF2169 domain-containing protein [Polyangiaceae bacterium]|nr:DUF2169 domain-containing protein [Polyangiaceae bacterium]
MHVISACPLRVSTLVWQARPNAWVLTVVAKATYRLEPRVSPLAAEQEDPNDDDNHWDDDPRKSLYAPSDLAPFKTRADVLLVGYAFAPGGIPQSALTARLSVGEVDKSVAVHADRSWTLDGRVREGSPFTRMPLRYERAAGGPDSANPVGIRPDVANSSGEIPIPNLWIPGRNPTRRGEIVEPIAFGPIASTWPTRRERLGSLARSFSPASLRHSALPGEVEPAFFNAAPRDQQMAELRPDERIVLENLSPGSPRFVTNLSGVAPRAFLERPGTAVQEIALRADTLWIDTDRGIATLTWRGQVPLVSPDEIGRVLIGMGRGAERPSYEEVAIQAARLQAVANNGSAADTAEIESLSEDDIRETNDSIVLPPPRAPLSGAASSSPAPSRTADAATSSTEEAASTLFLIASPDASHTLPFAGHGQNSGPDVLRKAEQAAAATRGQDALPSAWTPPAPSSSSGAGASPPAAPVAATAMFPPGFGAPPQPPVPPAFLPSPAASFNIPDMVPPPVDPVREVAVVPLLAKATDAARDAGQLGLAGLSDAAAAAHNVIAMERKAADVAAVAPPEDRPEPRPVRPAEILKLLWFDPKVLSRLQKHPDFRILLAEMELRALDEALDDEADTAESKARKSVFEVLSRGTPSPAESLKRALSEAVDERGLFEPPLVLLAGELEFPFDEVESLKAALTVLTPLAGADVKLKNAIEAATEFLKTPGADQFAKLAEGLLEKLREAFALVRKNLPVDYVDSNVERALLRQRAYSMKTLYGKRWIRALLRGAPASRGGEGAPPVYLPEALREELPAYKRVKVKAIGEVDLQEDQEESASWVVKVNALARVVSGI